MRRGGGELLIITRGVVACSVVVGLPFATRSLAPHTPLFETDTLPYSDGARTGTCETASHKLAQ